MSTARKCLPALLVAFCLLAAPAFCADKKEESKPKIDVNSATAKEMADELPGVGEVTAKKIVEGRPYKNADDLVKAGVSEKVVEKLTPLITFGKAAKEEPKTAKKTDKKDDKEESASKKTDKKDSKEEVAAKTPPQKGMVWVNSESKIYHKEGDRWYGKTKNGEFMTEAEALKMGARASKEAAKEEKK